MQHVREQFAGARQSNNFMNQVVDAFRKNQLVQIGSNSFILIRPPTALLRCLHVTMRTMLLRRASHRLFSLLPTLLYSRHRARLVEPLSRVLLPPLRMFRRELSIARLLTSSVHTRCLPGTKLLENPSFRGEMDSYGTDSEEY